MSSTISNALTSTKDKKVAAIFLKIIDNFFDSLNVTALGNGKAKRKSFQSPYTNSNDFQLKVLPRIHSYSLHNVYFLCSGSKMSLSHI